MAAKDNIHLVLANFRFTPEEVELFKSYFASKGEFCNFTQINGGYFSTDSETAKVIESNFPFISSLMSGIRTDNRGLTQNTFRACIAIAGGFGNILKKYFNQDSEVVQTLDGVFVSEFKNTYKSKDLSVLRNQNEFVAEWNQSYEVESHKDPMHISQEAIATMEKQVIAMDNAVKFRTTNNIGFRFEFLYANFVQTNSKIESR